MTSLWCEQVIGGRAAACAVQEALKGWSIEKHWLLEANWTTNESNEDISFSLEIVQLISEERIREPEFHFAISINEIQAVICDVLTSQNKRQLDVMSLVKEAYTVSEVSLLKQKQNKTTTNLNRIVSSFKTQLLFCIKYKGHNQQHPNSQKPCRRNNLVSLAKTFQGRLKNTQRKPIDKET